MCGTNSSGPFSPTIAGCLGDKEPPLANPATSILVAFQNPFTWYKCANRQKGTSGINLSWYVTNALRVEFSSATNINLVAPASFDMFLEAPLKAGGSC